MTAFNQEKERGVEPLDLDYFEEYLQIKGYSSSSRTSLIKSVRRFKTWLESEHIEEGEVRQMDVLGYIKTLEVKQLTLQQYLNALNRYFMFLVEIGGVVENPIAHLKIKGVKRRELYDLLSEEYLDRIYQSYPFESTIHRRNKVMLGLFIYQGLTTTELEQLEPKDLLLREGKLDVPSTRRSNSRKLDLQPFQIIDLQDYLYTCRSELLTITKKQTDKLFLSHGSGHKLSNTLQKLLQPLKSQHTRLTTLKQVRASRITLWLKQYNLRKVQYLSGHKYVSSTEKYQIGNLDSLKEDISKFHPIS